MEGTALRQSCRMRGYNLSYRGRKNRSPMVVDVNDPRAMAQCDGCGFWLNHKDLAQRMAYRGGTVPVWDGFLVCQVCDDVPNPAPQFSRLTLQPDPVPVENPRVQNPVPNSGFGYMATENGDLAITLGDGDTWGGEYGITIPVTVYP